ncbi:hypothetical protein RN001_003309 [Aquatica leii]|uniref:Craniofacial development protein 2-like n=1 Tax=Aquatica leii TaxID=1421715 RepID=A0AAN7SRJ6_9COLE|nr:hypothetical protein RN001_003309 [Aquatica leii]
MSLTVQQMFSVIKLLCLTAHNIAKRTTWKIGTWNVRSISDKEKELVEEFEKTDLDILGITETKKKGTGELELQTREGVGCIIKKEKAKYIIKWTSITARILHIEMDIEKHNKTSILVVYGPDENATAKVKDEFWNQLTEIID